MSLRTSYAPGIPSWVDVMVTKRSEGTAFYGALFGWTFEDSTDPESGAVIYTNCFSNGHMVCGLMEMSPEMQSGGMPPVWGTYIATADADETAQRVTAAGGTVMMPPMDVMDVGRMAVFADPTGAVLGLWQAKTHKGAELVNEPGGFCWNELDTRDTTAASAFYEAVFGWKSEAMEGPMEYFEWKLDGETIGGMMPMPGEMPAAVPPFWLVYFAVENCDGTLEKLADLGGSVMAGPMDIPAGRFAVVMDPAGAAFAVMQLAENN